MIAQPNAAARTACHVCFPDAFDQRGPCLTSGVPAPARAPRGRYLAERGPGGFPVIAVLPSMFVTATFCRRVVSWRGVLFGHNRTRPLHIWDGGALLGLPHQAGQFPSSPGSSGRPSGPSTRAKCQFPSSSHVPGVAPGWYPFPTPARAKHLREVPVSQLFPRPRGCPRSGVRFRRPPGPNTRVRCQFPSPSHVPGVSSRWCPFPAVNEFLLPSRGAAQAPREK